MCCLTMLTAGVRSDDLGGEMPKQKLSKEIRAYFAAIGAKGDKRAGGRATAASMTKKERKARAQAAARARWKKAKVAR